MRWLLILAVLLLSSAACTRPSTDELDALAQRAVSNMVFVEGGSFEMGGIDVRIEYASGEVYEGPAARDRDVFPVHTVSLDGYYISKYETTYGEYDLFTQATGGRVADEDYLAHADVRGPDKPASGMTWDEARAYCQWLGKITGLSFDLPTEAQWEYSARSRGLAVAYATDNGRLDYGRNYKSKDGPWHADPPGSYPPNPLGLFDMSGNMGEWVLDWHGYYDAAPQYNPHGPADGVQKVIRGLSLVGLPDQNTLQRRAPREPSNTGAGGGIRCVINSDAPLPKG